MKELEKKTVVFKSHNGSFFCLRVSNLVGPVSVALRPVQDQLSTG